MLAHKIELNPNNKQRTYFAKAAGVARFSYNWALSEWQKEYDLGLKPSDPSLRRKLNSIKREQFPWMLDVTKNAPQMAIIQLGQAFKNFFAKRAAYPQFRKKGIHDRFTLSNDQFTVDASRIRIPHLGWVRMRESLRFEGKILSATISHRAKKWFVSLNVAIVSPVISKESKNQATVGIDLGLTQFATLSTGEIITGSKPHKAKLRRLKRLSKSLSRKQKGSSNRKKAQAKLAKLHYQISNIRHDAIHQLTTRLTDEFSTIVIEDLNVSGMAQNRKLSRSISDMGFFEFRRQLVYKSTLKNTHLIVADRWFASSKLCSVCTMKNSDLALSMREWECRHCGAKHHRDINAAKNLEKLAVSFTVSACGASSGGVIASAMASHDTLKQESNAKLVYG
jgi:putative transposase